MAVCRCPQSSGCTSARTFSGVTAKCRRVDAENPALALVPHAVAVDRCPSPRSPCCRRPARGCGAARSASSRAVEASSSAVRAATRCFKLGVEPLELPGLAVKLGEDPDLGAQHLGDDRHRHVVHRAHLVAAQAIHIGQMDGGDEDHRRLLEARMLADHRRELEAVEIGHADVDQNDGDFRLEQVLERLAAGRCLDQIFAELPQDHLIAQQLRRLIVDQQDIDLVVLRSFRLSRSSGAATCAAPTAIARC